MNDTILCTNNIMHSLVGLDVIYKSRIYQTIPGFIWSRAYPRPNSVDMNEQTLQQ